jgi:hypothetical protein
MCNPRFTFVTSRGNICNICPKQLKHLQHTFETLAKHQKKLENHVCSRYRHLDETTCNIHMKIFETLTYICNIQIYFCNIYMKHLQHTLKQMKNLEPTLETYVYSHYNMCNILIYFCDIDVKHLQHSFETSITLEIYACNMCFLVQYHLAAWTNGGSSLQSSTSVRRSVVTHGTH